MNASTRFVPTRTIAALAAAAAIVAPLACGGDGGDDDTLTFVVYDSYPDDDPSQPNPLQLALDEFTEESGIEIELLKSQDAGTMVSKAVLTAGNPEGDVMWGVDNTLLSRLVEGDVFEPYLADGVDRFPADLTELVPNGEATPVDYGDVCVNYDIAALEALGVEPPRTLDDLTRPEYADLLVVENAATSSPGLAFLMATVAEFGEQGWEGYWQRLRDNGVLVVDGWNEAYYSAFTRAGGDRPLVVSYGSSPPFEVLFATEPLTEAPTGVVEATCFRQVEFAGVLAGTDSPDEARRLVDFLVSERFQREVALNLFVFPANPDVELEPEFAQFATIPDDPLTIDPAEIDANRADWIERWMAIVA
jgi:thiamine transport system substrate-binding protein